MYTNLYCRSTPKNLTLCCFYFALMLPALTSLALRSRSVYHCHYTVTITQFFQECCDCCLLAKELLHKNQPCVAPTGFSASCLKSFSRCCQGSMEIAQSFSHVTDRPSAPILDSSTVYFGDRCANSKCEHLCNDRGGETVECSCRSGYDLAPDGYSCVDRNECRSSNPPCVWGREVCVNLIGGYRCERLRPSPFRQRFLLDKTRFVRMREDDRRAATRRMQSFIPIPTMYPRPDGEDERICPSGWQFKNKECVDVDECSLGSHDCGPLYQCRNTQGSYRCDPKKCAEGELQNPQTGECISIDCPLGYYPSNGMCHDVNECATGNRCAVGEECVNTAGSFRCEQKGNICAPGYAVNENTGFCDDINECVNATICGGLMCINLPGSYKCRCNAGYEFNERTKRCEDVDECEKFAGHVCDLSAECQNTIGSFICKCKKGFELAADGRRCEDVNECATGEARCEQKCINIPGSYQCICDRGYTVGADGRTCEDIDECSLWAGTGSELCMGRCVNTKGSYICQCPAGYKIQSDGRTCVDVDECALGECQGRDQICVNTLGHFKCHQIECPTNYVHDSNYKNRIQDGYSCLKVCMKDDVLCHGNHTKEILYQFRALPSMTVVHRPIEVSRIRTHMDTPFSVDYYLDSVGRRHFVVEQDRNIGIVKLVRPLVGPTKERIRVHIHPKSRTGVILAYNVAIIEVDVSPYFF
ncbi:Fibulin-1, variant 2 [Parelaphostrongylus tenuis]|uniref:Fibulin-1 n=1 Tax=Parelaphostrongylus tenuis TaxID=148309 RepID=A0AAD5QC72_PARTN|nr:Fibulin-1, variant 2 [Parelaphostrongylus tenuis]